MKKNIIIISKANRAVPFFTADPLWIGGLHSELVQVSVGLDTNTVYVGYAAAISSLNRELVINKTMIADEKVIKLLTEWYGAEQFEYTII